MLIYVVNTQHTQTHVYLCSSQFCIQ